MSAKHDFRVFIPKGRTSVVYEFSETTEAEAVRDARDAFQWDHGFYPEAFTVEQTSV